MSLSPGVEESLRQLHAVADLAVVSAANESAIASEWKHYGLARHADVIFGQEVGSKANSIATMLACGYESRKVLMVGDSMGDAQAAAANGVAFVPILPGREADSWRRLQEEAPAEAAARHLQPGIPGRTAGRPAQCPCMGNFYLYYFSRRHPL